MVRSKELSEAFRKKIVEAYEYVRKIVYKWRTLKTTVNMPRLTGTVLICNSTRIVVRTITQQLQKMDVNCKIYGFLTYILQTLLLSSATLEPFDLLYDNGVEAFYKGDYDNVVRYMEDALKSFSEVRQTRIRCRLKCGDQHRFDSFLTDKVFEVILYRGHCLNQCIEGAIGPQSVHKVSEDVIQDFNRRIPYNYLQLAYRK
ncbi:hypothetical protein QQF64_019005, partial [Cirrhinus molitorella]